jgi:hypothetical protein
MFDHSAFLGDRGHPEDADTLRALRDRIEIAEAELATARQELFEIDRHAAWLAQERQRLSDLLSALVPGAAGDDDHSMIRARLDALKDELRVKDDYILLLERMISDLRNGPGS